MDSISTAAEYLERKTQEYWAISKVFFAGVGIPLTTTSAIHKCNEAIDTLGPQRALRGRLFFLQDKIIQGRKKPKKSTPPDNITQLVLKARALP